MTNSDGLKDYFPRDVAYDGENDNNKKNIYTGLQRNDTPFKNKDMTDIFMYAAIFGFIKKKKIPLKKRQPNISTNAFSDKQKALLLTIAIAEGRSIDVLFKDQSKTSEDLIKTIEEYANAGIDILKERFLDSVEEYASPEKIIEGEIRAIIEDFKSKY